MKNEEVKNDIIDSEMAVIVRIDRGCMYCYAKKAIIVLQKMRKEIPALIKFTFYAFIIHTTLPTGFIAKMRCFRIKA